jgi:hypothetical protein
MDNHVSNFLHTLYRILDRLEASDTIGYEKRGEEVMPV